MEYFTPDRRCFAKCCSASQRVQALGFVDRQVHEEHGATRAGLFQSQLAAMGAHQVAGDGQAQTGATIFAGADEGLEQIILHAQRQAGPVIGNA